MKGYKLRYIETEEELRGLAKEGFYKFLGDVNIEQLKEITRNWILIPGVVEFTPVGEKMPIAFLLPRMNYFTGQLKYYIFERECYKGKDGWYVPEGYYKRRT